MRYLHGVFRLADMGLVRAPALKRLMRPSYYSWNAFRYGSVVKRNKELKDRFAGRRCFILGTGVSLDEIDLRVLADEHVFGCSYLFKHPWFSKLKLTCYADFAPLHLLYTSKAVWENHSSGNGMMVTAQNASAMGEDLYTEAGRLVPMEEAIKRAPYDFHASLERACPRGDTIFLHNAENRDFFRRAGLYQGRQVHYVMKAAPPIELAPRQSHDLAGRITFLDGVVFFAVAAAIYMGFKEIVLCGCGYTFLPKQQFHFYDRPIFVRDESDELVRQRIERFARARDVEVHSIATVPEGFCPILVKDEPVDVRHSILRRHAEANGVVIRNVVPDGYSSPVYEATSWAAIARDLPPLQDDDGRNG